MKPTHAFGEAAVRWAKDNEHLRAIDRDMQDLKGVMRFIDNLPLKQVHQVTLEPYIEFRREQGVSSETVKRALSTVTRVLTAAHQIYRDEEGDPWLTSLPKFQVPKWSTPRPRYPLSGQEAACLLQALSDDLKDITQVLLHTGLRDIELRTLRWDREQPRQEGCAVFLIPEEVAKNKQARLAFCNRVATRIIDQRRHNDSDWVFPGQNGDCRTRLSSSGWRAGRIRAAEHFEWSHKAEPSDGFRRVRIHDLRHTFGERLRLQGVNLDTCGDLLGHVGRGVTAHYCRAQDRELLDAVRRLEVYEVPQNSRNDNVVSLTGSNRFDKQLF
ncbi:MAG: tyrosine-type recombinase/integrase [Pseudomonadales bacterium]